MAKNYDMAFRAVQEDFRLSDIKNSTIIVDIYGYTINNKHYAKEKDISNFYELSIFYPGTFLRFTDGFTVFVEDSKALVFMGEGETATITLDVLFIIVYDYWNDGIYSKQIDEILKGAMSEQ